MSDIEKEIRSIHAKIDKVLHALGLDGSASALGLREKARTIIELKRMRPVRKKTARDPEEQCR